LPHVAGDLVARAQDARLKTFARPKGGGKTIPLAPSHWEVDPDIALHRLASCSINPEAYLDPKASQTHWIFIDKADLDREMRAYEEERERTLETEAKPPTPLVKATIEECAIWLTQQFAEDPSRLLPKGEFEERAKLAFGSRLSGRGFLSAWELATADHTERRSPGPREGSAPRRTNSGR
jgi:hypothetical protein